MFLEKIHSILKDNSIFHIVTDDAFYALEVMNPILKSSNDIFENVLEKDYLHYLENYKQTLYEEKMRAKGLNIHFFVYKKI